MFRKLVTTVRTIGGAATGLIALPIYRAFKRTFHPVDYIGAAVGISISTICFAITQYTSISIVFDPTKPVTEFFAAYFGISLGGWLTISGFSSARKTAYACYHLGFVDGVKFASEDTLTTNYAWNNFKNLTHYVNLQKTLQNSTPGITPAQIEDFKKIATPDELNKLATYEEIRNEKCPITLSPLNKLNSNDIVTLEQVEEKKDSTQKIIHRFYFNKSAFTKWVETKKLNVDNPINREPLLNNPIIKIYAGLPESHELIELVESKLSNQTAAEVKIDIPSHHGFINSNPIPSKSPVFRVTMRNS